jgi:hypothetical protein
MAYGDFLESNPKLAALIRNLVMESIAERVRMRALLELLEEKGLLLPGEFDFRAQQVWERDFDSLSDELWQRSKAEGEEAEVEREVCVQCGALCCKYVSVTLMPGEAELLKQKAKELGIERLEITSKAGIPSAAGEPRQVLYASPCPFLNEDNLCRIHDQRPKHCRGYPYQWQPWCPLSHKWYGLREDIPNGGQGP